MRRHKLLVIVFLLSLFFTSCGSSRKLAIRQEKADRLVASARSYLGTPYKWGGVNRNGLDCSGLLYCSFSTIDVQLPRTSEAQKDHGKKVKINELMPGDLLFFATGKRKRKVTHVGMVTEVKDVDEIMFIHSSTSRGVVENNLFQTYYYKRFRGARRIF